MASIRKRGQNRYLIVVSRGYDYVGYVPADSIGTWPLPFTGIFATLKTEVIVMEFRKESGRIYATDEAGKLLAEVTFPEREGVAVINHTFVDASLRGQGVAGQLLRAVADTLRQDGRKARATCSYAIHWFETHPEEKDLLEP